MKTKVFNISLSIIRVALICTIVVISIFLAGRQPEVKKLFQKIITPSLANTVWFLKLDKIYTLCGHTESEEKKFSSEKMLNKEVLNLQDYILKKISGHRRVYIQEIPEFCASCQKNRFLGILDEKIVVFSGTPKKPGPVKEEIPILIEDLPKLELEDLKKGIPFKDNKEKLLLIEGLNAN